MAIDRVSPRWMGMLLTRVEVKGSEDLTLGFGLLPRQHVGMAEGWSS